MHLVEHLAVDETQHVETNEQALRTASPCLLPRIHQAGTAIRSILAIFTTTGK